MIGWLLRRVVRGAVVLLLSPLLLLRLLLERLAAPRLVVIRLAGAVPRFPQDEPPWRRFVPRRSRPRWSLAEALDALDEAARLPSVRAIAIELDRAGLSLVQAEELLDGIDRAKASGKKVAVWADGAGGPGLVVLAAGDRAYGVPEGQLEFLGLRVRAVFLHDLLALLGVVPDLDRHGDYKTMADMFTRREMSEAHREMAADLGGDLYEQVVTPLVVGRQLERAVVVATLNDGPVASRTAVEARLLDGVAYRDETRARAGALVDLDAEARCWEVAPLLARRLRRLALSQVLRDRPLVLVVELSGTIVSGESGRGCPAQRAIDALDQAREDRRVRAVVLRIESPGGSALASDDIWRAVKRLDAEKPVVASLGAVAASGGYYVAVGARRIVAHAASIVGSIGVVSGKLHLAPALFRWGVRVEGPTFGARAGMYDPDRGFTPEEAQANRRELLRFYEAFLERVAQGRGRTRDEVDALAQGRVYTGRRAFALGLVDVLGGVERAVEEAARLADLRAPRVLLAVPNRPGLLARLGPLGGGQALSDSLEAVTQAAALAREPALAYSPWRVDGV